MAAGSRLISVDFEIFGRVQGVFFRKNTQKTAKALHLVGWVMNTRQGTVQGQVQGHEDKVKEMKHWLETKGSKNSRIDKAVFTDEHVIDKPSYSSFVVKRSRTKQLS